MPPENILLAIFQQNGDDFTQVMMQLVEGFALAVRAGEARNIAGIQPRVRHLSTTTVNEFIRAFSGCTLPAFAFV